MSRRLRHPALAALLFTFALLWPGDSRADPRAGVRALRKGDYAAALAHFRTPPVTAEGRFYAGTALYKLDRHEEALEEIEAALDEDPSLSGELSAVYLGLTRYALKLYRLSRPEFELVVRGGAGTRTGQLAAEHLEQLDRLKAADESALGWYVERGLLRAAEGRHRLAVAYLSEARAHDPSYEEELVSLHLASALNALKRPVEALKAIGQLTTAGANVQRARALLALGKPDDARSVLIKAAEASDPTWSDVARTMLGSLE